MTIEKYLKENPNFDILLECELEFAEPDNSEEAKENVKWVLKNYPNFESLAVVVRSYYCGTIEW
jgi:hypothetical protein